MTQFKSHL